MRLYVRTITGKTISIDNIRASDKIEHLALNIKNQEGIAINQQRLIYCGRQLDFGQSISSYGITDLSTIHLVLKLLGMISTFTSNERSDPLVSYLMLTEEEREVAPVPVEQLRTKSRNADKFATFNFVEHPDIFNDKQLDCLCDFLDFIWDQTSEEAEEGRVDMRVSLPLTALNVILADYENTAENVAEIVERLKSLFYKVPGADGRPKLAFRMTRGPTNSCINFHFDGAYASSTTQIALNDPSEFKGGALCFFVNDRLHFIPRMRGSLVQHPPNVLHGVTSVMDGTRKSLFVVDESNGLGVRGVVEPTDEQIVDFAVNRARVQLQRKVSSLSQDS